MNHFYENVPGIGNVALSRHAQERLEGDRVTDAQVREALFKGETRPDGLGKVWREKNLVRLVIVLEPVPFSGEALVTTGFRVKPQHRMK